MRIIICLALASLWLQGQSPHFEVASIKPADTEHLAPHAAGPGTADPGHMFYTNVSLKDLVYRAYGPMPYQLSVPGWMEQGERFDIVAKVPEGTAKADLPLMLQSLLVERFHVQLKHEIKETQAYSLGMGKNGLRMKEYDAVLPAGIIEALKFTGLDSNGVPIIPPGYSTAMMGSVKGQTIIAIARQPVTTLCRFLSNLLEHPVVDQTGLTGRYDMRLHFVSDRTLPSADPETADASDPAPTLVQAVQNQLGLKLEPRKLPVDFLVVESADRIPTQN